MDTGLQHDKMRQILKTEKKKHLSPRQAVLANEWRTMESDAENFVPERASQLLQICTDQNKCRLNENENADDIQHWDGEDDDANDDDTEDLQIYDSLEVLAHFQVKKNPNPLQTNVGTEKDKKDGSR